MMKTGIFLVLSGMFFLMLSCGASTKQPNTPASKSSGDTPVSPETEHEAAILQKVASAPGGKTVTVGKSSFQVIDEYFAASGRMCKSIAIQVSEIDKSQIKTVCDFNGSWGFSPIVMPLTADLK